MKNNRHIYTFCYVLLFCLGCASKTRMVCNDLYVEGAPIFFSDSERKLLCGDAKNPAWNSIPRPQIIYHLKTFLLERGYFEPQIQNDPQKIIAKLGPRVRVESFEVLNWPQNLPLFHQRRYLNLPLTPNSLDTIESGAVTQLKGLGFPCAEVQSEAFPLEKKVLIYISSGPQHDFPETVPLPTEDINALTLKRYEAFKPKELYDYKLLELTERRIRSSGLVQDALYYPECNEKEEFSIKHKTITGKSRFFSVGAGFDTEQLAIARIRLSFNRLSQKGSSLESEAFASFRLQSLTNSAKFHLWPPESRTHLYSDFIVKHQNEKQYDTLTLTAATGLGTAVELRTGKYDFRFGPKGEYIKLYRGVGKDENRNISLEFSAFLTSHLFEYYVNSPQSGYRLGLNVESSLPQLGSTFFATRYRLQSEALWKLYDNYKLDIIWGLRAFLSSTHIHDTSPIMDIPPSYKHFLGGSRNMRGFGREELPRNSPGALSAAYLGSELRFARFAFLEPFAFADLGALGMKSLDFEEPYYVSPGIGLRWPFAFGTLRGTAAYGWTIGGKAVQEKSSPQFFLSFGEEF